MASNSIPRCVRFGKLFIENSILFQKAHSKRYSNECYRRFMCTAKVNAAESSGSADASGTSGDNVSKVEIDLRDQILSLSDQLKQASEKNETINDKYKRALAEGENIRTRLTKQIEDAKIFSIQSFCKDLLEVSDILQRATESVPKDEVSEKNPHLKSLYEGLTMTEAQLQSVFKRHGLVPVNPLNEKFNPNFHEALFQQEMPGKEPGTVIVVSKIGYKLQERVIRPALVGVAKGS